MACRALKSRFGLRDDSLVGNGISVRMQRMEHYKKNSTRLSGVKRIVLQIGDHGHLRTAEKGQAYPTFKA